MRILVTGGAGFIGSNFIRHVLGERPGFEVVNLDSLTYAGNLENLREIESNPNYRFVRGDVATRDWTGETGDGFDAVVHFAAESHVDRSILDAQDFVVTNVGGTQNLLDWARQGGANRFVQIGTDEVYGSLGADGCFTESTPIAPNSPYSASKAAADLLCRAAFRTHGQDVVVTRCSNNYGPYQFPEKLIPLMIANAMEDTELPVYGDGLNIRDWIHVEDHCAAVLAALENGKSGGIYNIGAENEKTNLDLIHALLDLLGKPRSLMRFVEDRPGHDRRYAIDATHSKTELGWRPRIEFPEGLRRTVEWYRENREWWERVRSGAYRDYYERWYGDR